MEKYGFSYIDIPEFPKVDRRYARHELFRAYPWAVWNSSVLEGYTFTLSEVETIIKGYSVAHHPLHDIDDVRCIARGWKVALEAIDAESPVDETLAKTINKALTEGMTIAPGTFRGEDSSIGGTGGHVRTQRGIYTAPPPEELRALWDSFHEEELTESAVLRIPFNVLNQFFWDGNKRTALMLSAVELIENGYPPVVVPAEKYEEWHEALTTLFIDKDATDLIAVLGASILDM